MSDPALLKQSKLPPEQIAVARRMRSIRQEERFSLGELARDCGLTKSALCHYEYGSAPLPFDAGNRICKRFDLNQRWLANGIEPKRPFIYPPDLAADSDAISMAEKLSFLEAYLGPLSVALEAWFEKNTADEIVLSQLRRGDTYVFERVSKIELANLVKRLVVEALREKRPHFKKTVFEQVERAVSELEKRLKEEISLDETLTLSDMSAVQISERIKKVRARLGLSQKEAAKKWDVLLNTLQSWEQGIRKPRGLALKQLETILRTAQKSGD